MFNLKEFIKKGLMLAIGNKPDYEIMLASVGWLEKDVLLESDLADIQAEIEKQYTNESEVPADQIFGGGDESGV
jgi:hypothetical protein